MTLKVHCDRCDASGYPRGRKADPPAGWSVFHGHDLCPACSEFSVDADWAKKLALANQDAQNAVAALLDSWLPGRKETPDDGLTAGMKKDAP